eukprot:scaffold31_cov263-Pinguiococcus_pyrenoidosus.AAC.6
MGRKRQRAVAVVPPPMKSRKKARQVTSRFHRVQEQLHSAEAALSAAKDAGQATGDTEDKLRRLRAELQQLGGREAYQQASRLQLQFCDSGRYVFQQLTSRGFRPSRREKRRPRVLEIGAVTRTLLRCPWLDVLAIDLKAQEQDIREVDFFQLEVDSERPFDAVVCAMVLNCVPTAAGRGQMLLKIREHLAIEGLLFVMLPKRCLSRSPHLTQPEFLALCEAMGYALLHQKASPKILYFVFSLRERVPLPDIAEQRRNPRRKKSTTRKGADVCNFDVRLSDPALDDEQARPGKAKESRAFAGGREKRTSAS